jgi:hypothetical protein
LKASSWRRGSSIVKAFCRSSVDGARRPGRFLPASVPTRQWRPRRSTASPAVRSRGPHVPARSRPFLLAAASRRLVGAGVWFREHTVGGRGVHARLADRTGSGGHLSPLAGHRRLRLTAIPRLRPPRRVLRRHLPRLMDTDGAYGFIRSITKPSSTCPCCARRGCCRFAAPCRRPAQEW